MSSRQKGQSERRHDHTFELSLWLGQEQREDLQWENSHWALSNTYIMDYISLHWALSDTYIMDYISASLGSVRHIHQGLYFTSLGSVRHIHHGLHFTSLGSVRHIHHGLHFASLSSCVLFFFSFDHDLSQQYWLNVFCKCKEAQNKRTNQRLNHFT